MTWPWRAHRCVVAERRGAMPTALRGIDPSHVPTHSPGRGPAEVECPARLQAGRARRSLAESSGPGSRRRKQPELRQQRLEPAAGAARAQVVSAELLGQLLVPVDNAPAVLDLRLRR